MPQTRSLQPASGVRPPSGLQRSFADILGKLIGEGAAPQPQAPTSAPGARLSRLPLARVKALVKADPDVTLAGQEAIFILARAAELFVETIAKDAYCCAQQGKRKTLQRRDLDNAIEAVDEFAFLEGKISISG
ncbi:PREDICTED: DNA polymerase epsilon subunit 4 [Myotis davidii]|nr:PREDICTED: DNA polymerase epsilon subunit 4 [Myotis davidii]